MNLAGAGIPRTSQELWRAADALLYEAKRSGKNCLLSDPDARERISA